MNPPKTAPRSLVTPGEAADLLNISLTYVTKLIVSGRFAGIQQTANGDHRIPLAEVERVDQEMRETRRAALDEIAEISRPLMEREMLEAKAKAKRRWVPKQS